MVLLRQGADPKAPIPITSLCKAMKKTLTALGEPIIRGSGSQSGVILPPKGHLAMSGDILVVTTWQGAIPGIWGR